MEVKRNTSKATLSRLPRYLSYFKDQKVAGVTRLSSAAIAADLNLNPVQVRKDLAAVGSSAGKPKAGFDLPVLIAALEDFLGYDKTLSAVLLGAGQLGRALLGYERFGEYGLEIVAAFDKNPELIGKTVRRTPVLPLSELASTIKQNRVRIGIITVGKENAQEAANALVEGGVEGIWSFAPQNLVLPSSVAIRYEDMAASLVLLSKMLPKRD